MARIVRRTPGTQPKTTVVRGTPKIEVPVIPVEPKIEALSNEVQVLAETVRELASRPAIEVTTREIIKQAEVPYTPVPVADPRVPKLESDVEVLTKRIKKIETRRPETIVYGGGPASGSGGGPTTWGSITGTLSDQTDLQIELDNKSDVGHSHAGLAPSGGLLGEVLKKVSNTDYDYSWQTDNTGSGGLSDGDYGDVVVSGVGTILTIDADAVSNSKLAEMAASTIKGNNTGGLANPTDLTVAQVKTLLAYTPTDIGAADASHTHTSADVTDFTEAAQDAVGTALTDTSEIDFTYNDGAGTISALVGAIAQAKVTNLVADLAGKADTVHTHAQADVTNLVTDLAGKHVNIQVQDEGSNLGTAGTVTTLNFTGAGVTASRATDTVTVNIAGGGAGSGSRVVAVLDFGSTPTDEATVVVTSGAGSIVAGSFVKAYFMRDSTADNGVEDHEGMSIYCALACGEIVPSTSFTVRANMLAGYAIGQFNIVTEWY